MKLKNALLTASMGLALSLGATSEAHAYAFNLGGYSGGVSIKYNLYTAECTTPVVGGGSCYGGDVPGYQAGANAVPPGNGYLNETTYGIGRITTIQDSSGNIDLWQAGNNGEQLMIFLYGIADAVNQGGSNSRPNLYNVGCQGGGDCDSKIHWDVYKISNASYIANGGLAGYSTNARKTFSTFNGITNNIDPSNNIDPTIASQLVFKMTFAPGIVTSGQTLNGFNTLLAELVQTVNSGTLPTTGEGAWLGNCVPGTPACSGVNGVNFNTNSEPNGTDFFGQFTLTDQLTQQAVNSGWRGFSNDPILTVNAVPVPEPSALLLLSGGLLGLSAVRRMANRRSS